MGIGWRFASYLHGLRPWLRARLRSRGGGLHVPLKGQHAGLGSVEAGELGEAHLVQRPADGQVQALPGMAHLAGFFEAALAVARGTVRDGEGAFQRIQNGSGTDLGGRARKLVATTKAARGGHEARTLQLFEHLAHSR